MKETVFYIDEQLYSLSAKPIRNRFDLLRLLSHTLKAIVVENASYEEGYPRKTDDNRKLLIHIDKMSRIYYCLGDKFFSYSFPFLLFKDPDNSLIEINFKGELAIDSLVSSLLITIFDNPVLQDKDLLELYETVDDEIKETYHGAEIDIDIIMNLIYHLLAFEPGYLRYDDDNTPGRVNDKFHPRYHLDINYESISTYKIGLEKNISMSQFVEITDNTAVCAKLNIQ